MSELVILMPLLLYLILFEHIYTLATTRQPCSEHPTILEVYIFIYFKYSRVFTACVVGMTLNCIHIFIVTGNFLYWCVMRPASQRFFIHSCIYLRILIISYLATFLGTNSLSVLMCRKAVNQSINRSCNNALVSLHWLRVVYKIAVLTFKVLHRIAPEYLGPVVRVANLPGRQSLRSAGTNRVVVGATV